VGDGDVQAVGIVVGDILPVDVPLAQGDPAERLQLVHAIVLELEIVVAEHLAHGGEAPLKPHEDEAQADLVLDGNEVVGGAVEVAEGLGVRHPGQAAAQVVAPGVVRAGHADAAVAARPIDHPRGAVAANVVEGADLVVVAAHHDQALAEEVEGVEVPRLGNVRQVADDLPAGAEHRRLLRLEEICVVIDPAGQAEVGEVRVGVRVQGLGGAHGA
jgi:hypothetical protein